MQIGNKGATYDAQRTFLFYPEGAQNDERKNCKKRQISAAAGGTLNYR